jgi:hypothetical protein
LFLAYAITNFQYPSPLIPTPIRIASDRTVMLFLSAKKFGGNLFSWNYFI